MPVKHRDDLWEKPPHTEIKHEILRRYIQAWLPILGSRHERIAIIDGFAGPGEYKLQSDPDTFEPGSPIIIFETILTHKLRERFPNIILIFIEKNSKFANHLGSLLNSRYPSRDDQRIKHLLITADFASTLHSVLDEIKKENQIMVPCFAFIDPFGPSGMPMDLITKFMAHRYSEIFVNFAYDSINRWLNVPEYEKTLDSLYGCPDWRSLRGLKNPQLRREKLLDLYVSQLEQNAGAKYVLSFAMKDQKNRPKYYLIFGTKALEGLDQMKQTMWKVDQTGNFEFSDYKYSSFQLELFPPTPDYQELAELIWNQFHSSTVEIRAVEDWVVAETPRYASNHVRTALRLIEEQGRVKSKYYVEWDAGKGRYEKTPYTRKGAFPKGTWIEFVGNS